MIMKFLRISYLTMFISAAILAIFVVILAPNYHRLVNFGRNNSSFKKESLSSYVSLLTGTYTGTVAIDKPLALGILDISLAINNSNGTLSGVLNSQGSLAFPTTAALNGAITGQINGITPTFRINVSPFTGMVSGRQVTRALTIEGTVEEEGKLLRGVYTETISGFTPDVLVVNGNLLASRASAANASNVPVETPVPGNARVYLPVIANQKPALVNSANGFNSQPTVESTHTPPALNESSNVEDGRQVPEATATSEYHLYLPSVVHQ